MTEKASARRGPSDPAEVPATAAARHMPARTGWEGPTYYGRSQLKAAPFSKVAVGAFIFLAGLSGAASLLSCLADLVRGREAAGTVRRGRYLSLLAPALGPLLLIYDLHTPKRFYNMLRLAKSTSPMSLGSWTLVSFGLFSGVSAAAQFAADRWRPKARPARRLARTAHVPAALAGAGLSTYTAALLSATSTPLWAAAPAATAVRFGASSVASGAAALSLGEDSPRMRRALDGLAVIALATELAADAVSEATYRRKGIEEAQKGAWGKADKLGGTGMGILAPIALYSASRLLTRRDNGLATAASVAVITGSALMRIAVLGAGAESAARPEVSFRFSQPENLRKH